ncbi:alpha/beta hydrolase [Desulfobacula sp.]|uniref:alpha/beta hydrolase n=1 Tax=Desulfobacula sp. TaxID=2593537 RepID=UPI002616219E|nr:alpha/beta hydrolase [Desulfobacula sp.]
MNKPTSHILSTIFRYLKSCPTLETIGVERYRTLLEKSSLAFKPDPAVTVEPFHIQAIEAQWLLPSDHNENRIILYVHGGGYIAGSITSHTDLASRIGTAARAKVLLFNYRLAPEHPFPEGLTDVKTVYHWLVETYPAPHRISLVCDSAGAGLGLALLSGLLKQAAPLPACSVLISPWIDLECKNPSHHENREKDPLLSQPVLKKTARLYTDQDLSNPLISPINNTFSGITPLLIQTGEHEVLIDDSRILAKKLQAVGATVRLEIWEGMFHVWPYFAKYLSEGRQAIQVMGHFIQQYS